MDSMEQRVENLVDSILQDYQKGRDIDRTVSYRHPDKDTIIDMTIKLLRIVYPGYSRDKSYRIYNAKHNLSMLIEDVLYHMQEQIALVLRSAIGKDAAREQAQELSLSFISKLPGIRALSQTDVDAAFSGDPAAASKDEVIFCYPGLFAITVYRLAHQLHLLQIPTIPRIMTEYAHSVTGIDIHPGATIGHHFFIDHGTGIVIGETTTIGDHVKIYQGVTLGGLSTRGGQSLRGVKRHPTIEDYVTIYAGASILGGETVIGHHSVIGANAFITESGWDMKKGRGRVLFSYPSQVFDYFSCQQQACNTGNIGSAAGDLPLADSSGFLFRTVGLDGILCRENHLQMVDAPLFQLLAHDPRQRANRSFGNICHPEGSSIQLVSRAHTANDRHACLHRPLHQAQLAGDGIDGIHDIVKLRQIDAFCRFWSIENRINIHFCFRIDIQHPSFRSFHLQHA